MRINIADLENILKVLPVNEEFDCFQQSEGYFLGDKVTRYTMNPGKLTFHDNGDVFYGDVLLGHSDPIPKGSTVTIKEVGVGSYKIMEMDEEDEIRPKKHKYEEPFIEISVEAPKAPAPQTVNKPVTMKPKDQKYIIIGSISLAAGLLVGVYTTPLIFVLGIGVATFCFVRYYI